VARKYFGKKSTAEGLYDEDYCNKEISIPRIGSPPKDFSRGDYPID
jgi:hypothetical protein